MGGLGAEELQRTLCCVACLRWNGDVGAEVEDVGILKFRKFEMFLAFLFTYMVEMGYCKV